MPILKTEAGTFVVSGGDAAFAILRNLPAETLPAIQDAAELAQAGRITFEEAKEAAAKVDASAAGLFDPANWSGEVKGAIIGAIIMAIANQQSSPAVQNVTIHTTVVIAPADQPGQHTRHPSAHAKTKTEGELIPPRRNGPLRQS